MADLPQTDSAETAYQRGRSQGLATGALALSVAAFVNLLGLEKSILAIVLALRARRDATPSTGVVRRARAALVIAAVHIVTVVAIIVVVAANHDKLHQLLRVIQTLG